MDETASVRASWDWLQEIFKNWVSWVREHLLLTLLLSTAAFALGWAWNTYVMAVGLEGSSPGGQRTIATAQGETFNALFWLLLFGLVSGLVTYGWQRGWKQTLQDLAVLPRRLYEALDTDISSTAALLLWGAAVALVTASLITSAVSLALGLVLVTLAATPVGVIVNFAVIRLWRGLTGVAAPQKDAGAVALSGPFLVMVGEAFGLFVDWGVDSWLFSLVVGILAGGGSLLLARRGQGVLTGMFVLGMALPLLSLAHGGRAWADDGGWAECITDSGEFCQDAGFSGFLAWFGSDGASTVMAYASIGGAFSGIGTAIGVGVGAAAATVGAGPTASADRSGPSGSSAKLAKLAGPSVAGTAAGSASAAASEGAAWDRVATADSQSDRESVRAAGAGPEAASGVGAEAETGPGPDRAFDEPTEAVDGRVADAGPANVLPDPPERSRSAAAEGPGSEGLASTQAPDSSGPVPDQGASVADYQDVLPEPPDRDEDEDDEEPTAR